MGDKAAQLDVKLGLLGKPDLAEEVAERWERNWGRWGLFFTLDHRWMFLTQSAGKRSRYWNSCFRGGPIFGWARWGKLTSREYMMEVKAGLP